jgi:hypothetical protein
MYAKHFLSFLLILSGIVPFSYGQNSPVNFSYDDNGNRIKRWVEVLKMMETDSTSNWIIQDTILKKKSFNRDLTPDETISVYPNPSEGFLTLEIKEILPGACANVRLFTLSGQEMLQQNACNSLNTIDITSLAPGSYILVVRSGTRTSKWKIIREQ